MKLEPQLALPRNTKRFKCIKENCIFHDECLPVIETLKSTDVKGVTTYNAREWELLCGTKKDFLRANFSTFDEVWKKRVGEFGYKPKQEGQPTAV